MWKAGKSHLVDLTYLEGAGHLLATPFIPLSRHSKIYMSHLPRDRKSIRPALASKSRAVTLKKKKIE